VSGASPVDGPGDGPGDREAEDPGADTQMWQAFASGSDQPAPRKAVGAPFRIVTLLGGLIAFGLIVWLVLLR
jgi:hypothetical protein